MYKIYRIILLLICVIILASCSKSKFLEKKSDEKLIVPESIEDLNSMLDNVSVLNGDGFGINSSFAEIAADNYYSTSFSIDLIGTSWEAFRNLYIWSDNYNNLNNKFYEWDLPYKAIFYCNVVLDGLSKIDQDVPGYDNAKASALFFRSEMFFQLASLFAPSFDPNGTNSSPAIPLKLKSDISEKLSRATVAETYDRIITDLKISYSSLPSKSDFKTRPTKPAAAALLARVYLSMKAYDSAWKYSDLSLGHYNKLIDYNDISIVDTIYAPGIRREFNDEIIFYSRMIGLITDDFMNQPYVIRVDTNLYKSYDLNDLRRLVFYGNVSDIGASDDGQYFKGSYAPGYRTLFGGIAVDEVYLIRAECYARLGKVAEAMSDLNTLMIKRWKENEFALFEASDKQDALNKILSERRKELVFRGLRWFDLRRLNDEGANIMLTRVIEGQTYSLAPSDKRYTFLIPADVMSFNPSWQQNSR